MFVRRWQQLADKGGSGGDDDFDNDVTRDSTLLVPPCAPRVSSQASSVGSSLGRVSGDGNSSCRRKTALASRNLNVVNGSVVLTYQECSQALQDSLWPAGRISMRSLHASLERDIAPSHYRFS